MRLRYWRLRRFARRTKIMLGTALMFLAVLGIFTFPLFILEEASQITIWGTWQAEKSDMIILKEGISVVENINRTMKTINTCGGWLHPLSFLSYRGYSRSLDFWIMASKAKIVALDPQLMDGEDVSFLFSPHSVEMTEDGPVLVNRTTRVMNSGHFLRKSIPVRGRARWQNGALVIKNTLPQPPVAAKGGEDHGTDPIP